MRISDWSSDVCSSDLWPGQIPERYRNCAHMLIDTGSARSCDMSYARAADLYLGDASSQVYEFLLRPRPCVFLDTHATTWQNDPNYQHWLAGPVLGDVNALEATNDSAFAGHADESPWPGRIFDHRTEESQV